MSKFEHLLEKFTAAVEGNDGESLAALFTPSGTYDDGFFGTYIGREEIVTMLQSFHDTGQNYYWEFFDILASDDLCYGRYRFSYKSRLPGHEGNPVCFEGIGCFKLRGGKIERYSEIFDQGIALVQVGFSAERIKSVLVKAADRQNASSGCRRHLDRLATS